MNLEKKQFFFLIFWARRGLIITPTYLHVNGESGLRRKTIWKII